MKKTIKAWIHIYPNGDKYLYLKRKPTKEVDKFCNNWGGFSVPCVISYSLPKSKKK